MTDKPTPPPRTMHIEKGYKPASGNIQNGYQGPTGSNTTPPTGGSSVTPPSSPAKK